MKPAVSYYGGKQRQAPNIVPLLPPHTVYVEPFCGGAAILFAKPHPPYTNNNHYREVINDLDGDLINFYRTLRGPDGPKLIDMLKLTPYSRAEHKAARHYQGQDPAMRAHAYYVDMMQSFANERGAGWGTGVYSRNHAASWTNGVDLLPQCLARLRNVHIEQDDALAVIERWDSPQTCFYCDPPYPGAYQGHYGGYTTEDFAALVELLNRISGSFVLSNYDQPGVPAHWERFEFRAVASASGKGNVGKGRDKTKATTEHSEAKRRTEVVWRVDRSHNARGELAGMLRQTRLDF